MNCSLLTQEFVTVEVLDQFADMENIWGQMFGGIILDTMGYDADCFLFCKCSKGGYNIGWRLENGTQYVSKTFSADEILQSFQNKSIDVSVKVKKI